MTTGENSKFQESLASVQSWTSAKIADWASRLGTSWAKEAAKLVTDNNITGQELPTLIADSRPSPVLVALCSAKYASIDFNSFSKAINALLQKGYLSTVGM